MSEFEEQSKVSGNSETELREDVINTAVKFFKNPHVLRSPLAKSQQFLRSKGLTDREIQIACERSGIYNNENQVPILPPSLPMQQLYVSRPKSIFIRIREAFSAIAVLGGIMYAIYIFYKKFLRRLLFGEEKSLEDSMVELNKIITTEIGGLKSEISVVRVEIEKIRSLQCEEARTHTQLQDLKSEITSVKGLLLSRKQFPNVPGTSLVPPSIPAWQLSSVPHVSETDGDNKVEEFIETGSGSGSSETEVVTKNSDSSLEIM